MHQHLSDKNREFVLSEQALRSGTSIGSLIREAESAESDTDFIHKLSIALKEAHETAYWLLLLKDTKYIDAKIYTSISNDCNEIIKILASSIITLKSKKRKNKVALL